MLADRQQEILDFIRDQQQATGLTPFSREIQEHFGFASQTAVMDHLRGLELKGVLDRQPGKPPLHRSSCLTAALTPLRKRDSVAKSNFLSVQSHLT